MSDHDRRKRWFLAAIGAAAAWGPRAAANPAATPPPAAWRAAAASAALQALRTGGVVAAMRHASAPGRPGDPPNFDLADRATQRNLDARGVAQAQAAGAALNAAGVRFDGILTSRWARCRETAAWVADAFVPQPPVFDAPMLDNLWDNRRAAPTQIVAFQNWRAAAARDRSILLVSHGITVRTLIGPSLSEGELLVMNWRDDGTLREIGRLPPL